jgi:ankyrin repeat protein
MTGLTNAAKNGDVKEVINLINQGHDVNKANKGGPTPILWATANGHKEIVELLASNGADVNKADEYGHTPILWAVADGHKEIVELLASNGADVNKANGGGHTPILCAASDGHKEIVEFLASNGADVNKADEYGWTPVISAAQNGHKETVDFLANNGADIDKADKDGHTPIMRAAVRGHKETVAQLMVCGASLASPDNINTEVIAGTIQEAFSYLVEHEKNIPLLIEIIAKIKNQDNLPCTLFDSCKGALFKDANIWGDYIANIQFCNMTSKAEDKKKSSWSNVPEEVKRKIFSFRYGNSEQLLLSKEITAKYQQTIEKAIEAKREGGEEAFNRLEWSPRTKRKVS